jgi:uncharacterized protein
VSNEDEPILTDGERLGVQAQRALQAGETIERAPVIVIPPHQAWTLGRTGLASFLEPWDESGAVALPLGFCTVYRDDDEPNAKLVARPDEMMIDIVALRAIGPGEEIVVARLA